MDPFDFTNEADEQQLTSQPTLVTDHTPHSIMPTLLTYAQQEANNVGKAYK